MHLVRTICEENTSCKNYAEKWTHFATSLLYQITRFVITLLYQYTSCYSFIVGKMHLVITILWREHILQELYWKVNTFCYYFIVWDNTFCYNFTVSDKTSCYSFIVGENTSCWNYTVKRTHLAITILYREHISQIVYCMR